MSCSHCRETETLKCIEPFWTCWIRLIRENVRKGKEKQTLKNSRRAWSPGWKKGRNAANMADSGEKKDETITRRSSASWCIHSVTNADYARCKSKRTLSTINPSQEPHLHNLPGYWALTTSFSARHAQYVVWVSNEVLHSEVWSHYDVEDQKSLMATVIISSNPAPCPCYVWIH